MPQKTYYVYILANTSKTLYVGFSSDLERRIWQHRAKLSDGFTRDYNITMLVYFEAFPWVDDAIAREKQIKRWSRTKKIWLIEQENPNWLDLAADWFTDWGVKEGENCPATPLRREISRLRSK